MSLTYGLYFILPMIVAAALSLRGRRRDLRELSTAVILQIGLGFLLFLLFPAGPPRFYATPGATGGFSARAPALLDGALRDAAERLRRGRSAARPVGVPLACTARSRLLTLFYSWRFGDALFPRGRGSTSGFACRWSSRCGSRRSTCATTGSRHRGRACCWAWPPRRWRPRLRAAPGRGRPDLRPGDHRAGGHRDGARARAGATRSAAAKQVISPSIAAIPKLRIPLVGGEPERAVSDHGGVRAERNRRRGSGALRPALGVVGIGPRAADDVDRVIDADSDGDGQRHEVQEVHLQPQERRTAATPASPARRRTTWRPPQRSAPAATNHHDGADAPRPRLRAGRRAPWRSACR